MSNLIKELMQRYDEYRTKWISEFGTSDGFDRWFTQQVTGCSPECEYVLVPKTNSLGHIPSYLETPALKAISEAQDKGYTDMDVLFATGVIALLQEAEKHFDTDQGWRDQ